jgi:amino acid transporter
MKKTVWTYGLMSGALASALMAVTIPFQDENGLDHSLVVGYATIVLSFLLIYFGVRSYRDKVGNGTVRFGRALIVGSLIGLIASLCYVATWQVMYFKFMPDFMTRYNAHEIEKARAEGVSESALAQKKAELDKFEKMYQNPAINAAFTILEPLPVALVIALVSAGALSRRKRTLSHDSSPEVA